MTNERSKIVFSLLILFLFTFPSIIILLYRFSGWGPLGTDWDQTMHFGYVPALTIQEFKQFPLWDPYSLGGISLVGNPLMKLFSPHFFLYFLFQPAIALKIEGMIYLFVSLVSSWFFLRHYFKDFFFPLFGSMIYGLSGSIFFHIAGSHIHLPAFSYFPFLILFYIRSFTEKKYLLFSILMLAFINFDSITYPASIGLLGLFMIAIGFSFERKSIIPLKNFLYITVCSASICAIRLLPVFETLLFFPRKIDSAIHINLHSLYRIFLERGQLMHGASKTWDQNTGLSGWWGEYACYIGYIPAILCIFGMIKSFRNHKPFFFTFLICFAIYLGNFGVFSPWALLHYIFPFDSQAYPTRFIFVILVFMSFFSALAIKSISTFLRNKIPSGAVNEFLFLFMVIISVDLIQQNTKILNQNRVFKPQTWQGHRNFFQIYGSPSMSMDAAVENLGLVDKYDPLSPGGTKSSVIPLNSRSYRGEIFTKSGKGDVFYSEWSPNQLTIKTDLQDSDTIIVNQNFYPGWKVSNESMVHNEEGLIGFMAKPGKQEYILRYIPSSFVFGFWITTLSLLMWMMAYFSCRTGFLQKYTRITLLGCSMVVLLLTLMSVRKSLRLDYPLWKPQKLAVSTHDMKTYFPTVTGVHRFYHQDNETFRVLIDIRNYSDPQIEELVLKNLTTYAEKNYR